jgi:hypothetical protein
MRIANPGPENRRGRDQLECYRRLGKDIAASMLKQLGTRADIINAANKLLARYERRPRWRPR